MDLKKSCYNFKAENGTSVNLPLASPRFDFEAGINIPQLEISGPSAFDLNLVFFRDALFTFAEIPVGSATRSQVGFVSIKSNNVLPTSRGRLLALNMNLASTPPS
ncbi:hypothetical protein LZF95_00275 [Algoriphagus sp. AGSA1]|uniref:hypothetical protein n=1 Tax=Algoriphagus sp. AGSA1 TaxID=2907213 RepID=UPI001F376CE3|nr:hypothetical protein [Algoriphagus sp. AGSA1]MCE7053089.1 hypothetical protein [Algoriphagus sp. AGSA1]